VNHHRASKDRMSHAAVVTTSGFTQSNGRLSGAQGTAVTLKRITASSLRFFVLSYLLYSPPTAAVRASSSRARWLNSKVWGLFTRLLLLQAAAVMVARNEH
jgi:preprotein translocase subunit SecG